MMTKKRHNNYVFDAILVLMVRFSCLHGAKKSWGVGGGAAPPFANTFVTGSERVHMGSLLVRRYLKLACMVLKKAGGWGGGAAPPFANTFITGSERVHMGSVFAGAKILEASLRRAFGICRLLI